MSTIQQVRQSQRVKKQPTNYKQVDNPSDQENSQDEDFQSVAEEQTRQTKGSAARTAKTPSQEQEKGVRQFSSSVAKQEDDKDAAESESEEVIEKTRFNIALHNAPEGKSAEINAQIKTFGHVPCNLPSKLVQAQPNTIVVSWDGQYQISQHNVKLVNPRWLLSKNSEGDLKNPSLFGFSLKDCKICAYDAHNSTLNNWREQIEDLVHQNQGEFHKSDQLQDGDIVVIKPQSKDSLVSFVAKMFETLKITESRFKTLTILSENWLHETVKLGKKIDITIYNLGKAFTTYSQGEKSHFYVEQTQGGAARLAASEQQKRKALLDSNASVDQVIDDCKDMVIKNEFLLEDVVLLNYDEEDQFRVDQFASLTGATVMQDIVPGLVTHIVARQETPHLSFTLRSLHSQLLKSQGPHLSNSNSNQQKDLQFQNSIHLITIEWLKNCFLSQSFKPARDFKPPVVASQKSTGNGQSIKAQIQYAVKTNVFEQKTFAIREETFDDLEALQYTKKLLIQNGGRVVQNSNAKTNYVLFDDGFDNEIWKKIADSQKDDLNRIIVHPRWVEYCTKQKALYDHENVFFLSPLPQKVPVPEFENVGIQLCCFDNPTDKFIFTNLATVYGFKMVNNLEQTKYLICVSEQQIEISQKIKAVLKMQRNAPAIVSLEWLLDSMELGVLQKDTTDYLLQSLYTKKN